MGSAVEYAVLISLCALLGIDLVIQRVLKRRLVLAGLQSPRRAAGGAQFPEKAGPGEVPAVRRNAREFEVCALRRILRVVLSDRSREEVLGETLDVVSGLTEREWVTVLSHHADRGELEVLSGRADAIGRPGMRLSARAAVFAEAIESRRPTSVSGPQAMDRLPPGLAPGRLLRTLTVLPAVIHDRVPCLLVLADRRELPPLTEDETRTALGFADLAGMALEHDRLSGELGRKVRELSTLYEVAGYEMATITSSSPGIDDCLDRTLDLVHRLLEVDACSIMLLDERAQELYVHAGRGAGPKPAVTLRLRVGQGIAGRAAATGQPVVAENLAHDRRYLQHPGGGHPGSTLLAVPMLAQNRVVGVINVRSLSARRFTDDEVRTLQLIAGRTALSVDNARTRDHLEAERRKFEGIVATAADGIVLIDRGGDIVHANAAAERLVGCAPGGLTGRPWHDFCRLRTRDGARPFEPATLLARMVEVEGGNRPVALELAGADGTPRWVEARCGVVRDAGGQPALGVASLRDVTQELRDQMRREDRLRTMVEDVHAPLRSAVAHLEALAGERLGPLQPEQRRALAASMRGLRKVLLSSGALTHETEDRPREVPAAAAVS